MGENFKPAALMFEAAFLIGHKLCLKVLSRGQIALMLVFFVKDSP
jgi:hypothetical protein